jgi:hypothetical protein
MLLVLFAYLISSAFGLCASRARTANVVQCVRAAMLNRAVMCALLSKQMEKAARSRTITVSLKIMLGMLGNM